MSGMAGAGANAGRLDEFEVGQEASFSRTVTEADVLNYAGISGDYNPVHVDAEYARRSRFGQRIAHGMFTASLLSYLLGMRLPGPGAVYVNQTLKFRRPVFIGDTVTARVRVCGVDAERRRLTLLTACANQRGEPVLDGEAVMWIPPR